MQTVTRTAQTFEVAKYTGPTRKGRCLSCGSTPIKGNRRYCSKECRQQMFWVLALSKGLLRTLNTRYAAFFFTAQHVILDTLPVWSNGISRLIGKRTPGNKPAQDLKNLILRSGQEWHTMVDNRTSKSLASFQILERTHTRCIDPRSIRPDRNFKPRLSKGEKSCLKILDLETRDLDSDSLLTTIQLAYRRMAKRHHPDVGGDPEKFKLLSLAHEQMLLWAENPQYTSRKALEDCWSYDGSTNRWSPPL